MRRRLVLYYPAARTLHRATVTVESCRAAPLWLRRTPPYRTPVIILYACAVKGLKTEQSRTAAVWVSAAREPFTARQQWAAIIPRATRALYGQVYPLPRATRAYLWVGGRVLCHNAIAPYGEQSLFRRFAPYD